MRRLLAILLLALTAFGSASAQDYLVRKFKPIEEKGYNPHYPGVQGRAEYLYLSSFRCSNGFDLREKDYAVFSLKGAYETLSFVVGPAKRDDYRFAAGDDAVDIVIVTADGKRLVDEVIHIWDAPKMFFLDVSGADQIKFESWSGEQSIFFAEIKLWKKGQKPEPYNISNKALMGKDKVKLVEELRPHLVCHRGWSTPITQDRYNGISTVESISINRIKYTSGLALSASEELGEGISAGFAYFWLQKKFDKLSFIVGPRDNQSSNAKSWLVVKGDGKILLEKLVSQTDLAEVVVLDVKGVNVLSFHCGELEQSQFLGRMTFGVVDIYAYKSGAKDIPKPGLSDATEKRLNQLPSAVKLCSSIRPFSVQGIANFDNSYFDGATSHYHFSMGGEQFEEGFILTTGTTFMDGNISAYYAFDLAGQFDYVSFTVGTLSKRRVLGEDRILVYADDNLILDTYVHCLWPNQQFTLPIGKCRVLKFAKPGNGENKQTYLGVGDIMVFRGEPQPTEAYFYHRRPESPDEVDLIDYCQAPYFHYVGRYLSNLTNFDFNDCFKNGSSMREAFVMKDGSRISKGVMLETNVPPALVFEDIDLNTAIFLFVVGAGSSISASNVAAATGVSAGAGLAGALAGGFSALNLVGDKGHQSAVAAFNPFGQYETLTFTVANKSEFVDTDAFGAKLDPDNPVKLDVFADMKKVGEFWLTNRMQPTTIKVPIVKCTQLVFWLECGEGRSGQYVLYDMTLSKTPMPENEWPIVNAETGAPSSLPVSNDRNAQKGRVAWGHPSSISRVDAIDNLFRDVDAIWANTNLCLDDGLADYDLTETFVQTRAGKVYKAVSIVRGGRRYGFSEIIARNKQVMDNCTSVLLSIVGAYAGVPAANLGVLNLEGEKIQEFPPYVKLASQVLGQCRKDLKELNKAKEKENEDLQKLMKKALTVDGVKSTDKVLLLPVGRGDKVPPGNTFQMIEYYNMN